MTKTLNLHCPINGTSYGYVSCNIIKELNKLGYDLRYIPIAQPTPDEHFIADIKSALQRWDYDHDAPSLKIWHQHGLNSFVGRGLKIGMPIFELEKFNAVEVHSLNNPDELFVCSNWAKEVIQSEIPKRANNVRVVHLGFDEEIFKPIDLPSSETTIFANFGKFEVRKGHDVLPLIFSKAFDRHDNVALIMMPSNFFLNQDEANTWVNKYRNTKMGNKIQFIDRVPDQKALYQIMCQVHCGIFPSRAEGWNLEALELLACGRHLIITNCTAHTEFCNPENSNLIQMNSGYESAIDKKFFDGSFEWRKISQDEIDQAVEHLRSIHRKHQSGDLSLNSAGVETSKNFTWKNTVNMVDKNIEEMT